MGDAAVNEHIGHKDTALLIIDMQNDFLLPDAPMRVNGGLAIIPAVQTVVEAARKASIHVIWVLREHHASGCDVERIRKHLFENGKPGAVVPGTPGAALPEGLSILEGEQVLVKKRWSAFFQTHLELVLRRLHVAKIVIAGVQTPNCIRQTAFDAVAYDYEKVVVISDATAAACDEVHQVNLFDMRKIGIETPTVEEWVAGLA